jgi:hypothetical protein
VKYVAFGGSEGPLNSKLGQQAHFQADRWGWYIVSRMRTAEVTVELPLMLSTVIAP